MNTESNYLTSYTTETIQTDHLVVLAKLIGEIDWAPSYIDLCEIYFKIKLSCNITYYFICLACITESHQNVSASVGVFVHNLIAKDYLSGKQQDEFLALMDIQIPQDALGSKWPLQIYSRTLAILAQVSILYHYLLNFEL